LTVIGQDQSAYLPGRQIHDGLRTIDLIKDKCQATGTNGYLTSLDARKAYDSVSHHFIKRVLNHFGFNIEFQNIFSILYKDIHTRVNVNNIQTEKIPIKRGVKQGDALSCTLFILCMEIIIKDINANRQVPTLTFANTRCPKVVAYADDIALITPCRKGIVEAMKTYEKFSQASGLFLNAEKTEIINMRNYIRREFVRANVYNKTNNINLLQKLVICGKTYSCDIEIENEDNIGKRIQKMDKAIEQWNKRNLSTEGRIMIVKTFGISQIIYMMQNTYFSKQHLKTLEKKIYKFIWKGPDKIKRETLQQEYEDGGLKAPDIATIDKVLKLKQVLRTALGTHPVAYLQSVKIKDIQPYIKCKNTHTKYVQKALETHNKASAATIDEILLNAYEDNGIPTTKISKNHKIQIGLYNIDTISHLANLNPIEESIFKRHTNTFHIQDLSQLLNYCSEINHQPNNIAINVVSKLPRNIRRMQDENLLDIINNCQPEDISELSKKVSPALNIFKNPTDLKTSMYIKKVEEINEDQKENFRIYRNILNPREKNIQYMAISNKFYNNERLHRFGIINSPNCTFCNDLETNQHIFYDCHRALVAWSEFQQNTGVVPTIDMITSGVRDNWLNNIISLVKATLAKNRDEEINPRLMSTLINNRIEDLETIDRSKTRNKNLRAQKKVIVTVNR